MAREPLPPPGIPTLEPGCDEMTIPEPSLLPASLLGGARTEPESPGPPRPEPFLPDPDKPLPEPMEGGGGTTLFASSAPLPEPAEFAAPVGEPWVVPEPATDGGGGMTLDSPRDEPAALPEVELPELATDGGGGTIFAASDSPGAPAVLPAVAEPSVGGGGTTLFASEPPGPPLRAVPDAPAAEAVGGGGTTSCVPKSLPMTVLTNDPLLVGVGGGGTTAFEGSMLPLSRRRRSWTESAEGGGATTDGAGRLSLALRAVSRSGADTGGGTTATLFICTRVGATSLPTAAGAGGITLVLSAGTGRARSPEMRVDAGAITLGVREGAASARSRETRGAGAMMLGSSTGANKVCSERTLGAGGTTTAFRDGADRDLSEEMLGAGGTTELRSSAARDLPRVAFTGGGAITLTGRLGATREECKPSEGGGPGLAAFKASRLATAPAVAGSLRLGASTTLGASEPPRAT